MNSLARLAWGTAMAATISIAGGARAATFVYVSNAEDGDIGVYAMKPDGTLEARGRVAAAKTVMPMTVSPDKRFLYAHSRSKPYSFHAYSIDGKTGALKLVASSPSAESFPYISLDRTGRFIFGASYAGAVVSVNAVGKDGRVAEKPIQVIPVGRNAHSIRVDATNRYVYTPTLGSDEIFQFRFDAKSGKLASNTPAIVLMKAGTGPRHFITSKDNKFLYATERTNSTMAGFSVDAASGKLTYLSSIPTEKQPRGFAISPDGKTMVVSGEKSDMLAVYAIGTDGALKEIQKVPTGKGSNWVEVVSF